MDLIMPIQDGFITTAKILELKNVFPKAEPSYIIGCSGLGEKSKQECLDKGMNSYLEKPIKPVLLVDILK
jgi:CheY-like chemotaxis protein